MPKACPTELCLLVIKDMLKEALLPTVLTDMRGIYWIAVLEIRLWPPLRGAGDGSDNAL